MTPEQVISYYGTETDAAKRLQVTRQIVNLWKQRGRIPYPRQCAIQVNTDGKLRAKRNGK